MDSDEWMRVNKRRRCPVCDHGDWCLVSADGTAAICPRVESDKRVGDAGWLHRLGAGRNGKHWAGRPRRIVIEEATADVSPLAVRCAAAGARVLGRLGHDLGLSVDSLRQFGVGWLAVEGCWTWPMQDAAGKVVGINRRFADGSKRIMRGHKAGLYLPADLPTDLTGLALLACEGATDAVAAVDMGFWAIGRFNCTTGGKLVAALGRARRPDLVVIVADADKDGHRGAESLAADILPYCAHLKVVEPPMPHKDIRAWKLAGATHNDLTGAIDAARPRRLGVEVRNG